MAFVTAVQLTVAVLSPIAEDVSPVASPQATVPPMVKLVFEISKKMLPTASTFILAVVVGVAGINNASVPSLGVLAASTVGKVCPPSVLNEIFTLAHSTGVKLLLATLHVIVCVLPPAHVTAVFGTETAKGPDAELTVTTISLKEVWPTETGVVEL